MHEGITLRYAFPDDAAAVARLAALDSAEVPPPRCCWPMLAGTCAPRCRLSTAG